MVERRSRRPASSRRPRVAGHRKRAAQDRDAQHQEPPARRESDDAAAGSGTERSATDSPAAEDRPEETPTTEERADAEAGGESVPAEEPEVAGNPEDEPDDPTDVGVFGDSDTSEADTRALVVRDGLVEFDEVESGTDDAGAADDDTGDEGSRNEDQRLSDAEADTVESSGESATAARPRRALIAVLAVLTVLCASLAFWFQTNVRVLRDEGPASNEAMVDRGTTSEVNGEVSDAIATLFSYDFADTAKTENAAEELLVDDAVREYDQLFATVKKQAPKQKLVVTTSVKDSGVTYLQGNRARVLLFVDQNASRDGEKGKVIPAQISVGAEKRGGQWKIHQIIQR